MTTTPWLDKNASNILDAVVDAIVTIDILGQIQSVNAATLTLFGYDRDELIGEPVTRLMPQGYHANHQNYVRNHLDTGEQKIIGIGRELTARRANGEEFPIYLAISVIRTNGDTYFAGIMRDLSADKQAAQALAEQRDKLNQIARVNTMGEMTASIAHEINQPLTSIALYAQASINLLKQAEPDLDKVAATLDKLSRQSLRAGAVIERVQRFLSNDANERVAVNLNELLGDIEPLLASDARLHGICFDYQLDPTLPAVHCDPVQIQQVLLNLVRNAIDAMSEIDCANGNQVGLITDYDATRVRVYVQDCGPGVEPAQMDKIFTAFHTTKADGMGMGLAICQSIMDEHGGQLSVHPAQPEPGARFCMSLPIGEAQA